MAMFCWYTEQFFLYSWHIILVIQSYQEPNLAFASVNPPNSNKAYYIYHGISKSLFTVRSTRTTCSWSACWIVSHTPILDGTG
jgi:hypothetical protein